MPRADRVVRPYKRCPADVQIQRQRADVGIGPYRVLREVAGVRTNLQLPTAGRGKPLPYVTTKNLLLHYYFKLPFHPQTTHTCPAVKPRPRQTLQGWWVQAVRQRAHRAAASAAAVGISRNELINQMIAFALDNMDDSAEE